MDGAWSTTDVKDCIADVADLERLGDLTHKFEPGYLDQLVGPYPEAADTCETRSPANHADGIDTAPLLMQGEADPVVPLSQAEAIATGLNARGIIHELFVFEDEAHTLRRAASRQRVLEAELAFYGTVPGFEPADDLPALDLSTAGRA